MKPLCEKTTGLGIAQPQKVSASTAATGGAISTEFNEVRKTNLFGQHQFDDTNQNCNPNF